MSLLDGGEADPLGMGLLSAAQALGRPRVMGGGVLAGMGAFQNGLLQAGAYNRDIAEQKRREDYVRMQMAEIAAHTQERQALAEQRRATLEQQQRIARRMAESMGGDGMPAQQAPQMVSPNIGFGSTFLAPSGGKQPDRPLSAAGLLGGNAPEMDRRFADPVALPQQSMPQTQGARPSRLAAYNEYMRQAKIFGSEGDMASMMKLQEMAQKALPEVKDQQVVLVGGKPTLRTFFKDGSYEDINDAAPKPDIQALNAGRDFQMLDKNTGQMTGLSVPITMSAAEVAADARARQNIGLRDQELGLSKQRFSWDQQRGKAAGTITTDQGVFDVLPGADGRNIYAPALGPDGQQLQPRQTPPPAQVIDGIKTNFTNLRTIDSALQSFDTKEGQNAVGWKGYLPSKALNTVDPGGVDTRANIADIGSLVVHTRSGAAVTVSEYPRLQPFIPAATDDAATVKKKLTRMKQIIEEENSMLGAFYPKAVEAARAAVRDMPSRPSAPVDFNKLGNGAKKNGGTINFKDLN